MPDYDMIGTVDLRKLVCFVALMGMWGCHILTPGYLSVMKTYVFQISEADYIQAQKLHLRARPVFKMIFIIVCLIVICCMGLAILNLISGGSSLKSLGISSAVILYLLFLFLYFLPRRWKRLYAQSKLLQAEVSYSFREDALIVESEKGNCTIQWSDYHKWKVDDNQILLYQADNIFNIVPKRIFTDSSEADMVESYIRSALGKPR